MTACYADADQSGSLTSSSAATPPPTHRFRRRPRSARCLILSALKGSLTGLSQAVAIGDTIEFETSGTIANIERLAVRSRI